MEAEELGHIQSDLQSLMDWTNHGYEIKNNSVRLNCDVFNVIIIINHHTRPKMPVVLTVTDQHLCA